MNSPNLDQSDIHKRCRLYAGYYDKTTIGLFNPKKVRVLFGDNTLRVGSGGQACIRYTTASFGIATKLLPSQMNNSFF